MRATSHKKTDKTFRSLDCLTSFNNRIKDLKTIEVKSLK